MSSTIELVRFFRQYKALHCLEGFLLISEGVDNIPDLAAAMDCPYSQANRVVSCLKGRGRYHQGKFIDSELALIQTSQHPHQRGQQLTLTRTGTRLLKNFEPE
ncbi:hypothetical protein HOQ56_gp35 [uncultured phage_MedDCM-OCT-S38-C3]|uniref:Uncharacterized protein n=1 Tax=uncultured phage_MedDCM-OCT-S38-C3 TaxID=2740803 RepID=A0A6S4PAU8_9CAUD|nr:hypothetical protein HOQ56_gp35 [uncultured phage_MedDCM-OCT-S38-C3]BAQ94460.1 hypothetical protein [uncultured phage_MedDCM-OCT-S38-C3]